MGDFILKSLNQSDRLPDEMAKMQLTGSPMDEASYRHLINILEKNKEKDFVKRIINLDPNLTLPLGNGMSGTHMMAYSTGPEGAIVYPHIIQKMGQLLMLSPEEAYKYARQSGEYIPFTNPQEADWFGKNYKEIWRRQGLWEPPRK